MLSLFSSAPTNRPPWGLKWRSSVWFVTLVVGFGVATDLFSYAVIIPVIPFRLEALGYGDASARTGWLLFAYSGGLAVSTPPIAWFSERYNARRVPLLIGLFTLIGAQIMFMLAPFYWLMALARIIQGVSSTFVWTVGLALLCDTTPEARVGQQLGLAMTGLSAGVVLAPPIGGSLYQRLGFNAPFIFSIGIVLVDLAGRLLVIERKDAIKWGVDPAAVTNKTEPDQSNAQGDVSDILDETSLPPPTPNDTVSNRGSPVVLMDLDGKLVVVQGKCTDGVFGRMQETQARASSPEHNPTTEPSTTAAEEAGQERSPPGEEKSNNQVVFFDSTGQLTVIERQDTATWGAHEESLNHCFCDPVAGVRVADCTSQTQAIQHVATEKAEGDVLPQIAKTGIATGETSPTETPQLTSMQVLSKLFHSRRALAAFTNTLIYGITYSSQEPTLPLRLQDPYGMSSLKVGLVYIASSVPTLLSGPLAGWLSDRKGTGLITIICLLLSIPWFIVMAIHGPLAFFIVSVVVSNFFISAVVAPLTAELAAVTRELPGVGYSHVYGAFNLAYGIGSAFGPILGGQLYDHVKYGWTAVVGLAAGLMIVATTVAFFFTDQTPVAKRLLGLRRRLMVSQAPRLEA